MDDASKFENAFPEVFNRISDREFTKSDFLEEDLPIDHREVFDHIRDIKDPEHPMTLEQLGVVELDFITIDLPKNYVCVEFKPTIPHCSMATLIGLCIKVQLLRLLPSQMKVDVKIVPGTHSSFFTINKQLADKERVAAALENNSLSEVLNDCLMSSEPQDLPNFIEDEVKKLNLGEHSKILYIRFSRQQIKSYRRWKCLLDSIKQENKAM